jgi:hypothetical protein
MNPSPACPIPTVDLDCILSTLGISAEHATATTAYTVIPGEDGPRWLIPNRSEFAQIILREWRPYRPAARLLWLGICIAARTGTLRLVPRTAQVDLPSDAGSQLLGRAGQAVDALPPLILVGNPAPTRKLLIFLLSRAYNSLVLVKVPLTSAARASIRNEAETLKKLQGRYNAPRLIHYSEETGAATQAYVAGRLGSRRCKPVYLRLLVDLARSGGTVSLRARGRGLRDRLLRMSAHSEHAPLIDSALAWLEDDKPLPAALVHGDFAPWNIREMRDGSCTLIDWESAEWQGLPLHDLCHFLYMQTKLFSPKASFYSALVHEGSWRQYCSELDIQESFLPRLAAGFLLETLARNWELGPVESAPYCLRQLESFMKQAGKTRG